MGRNALYKKPRPVGTQYGYGDMLMRGLANFLTEKFGRGFSLSTLKNAKQFYNVYAPSIGKTPSAGKSQTLPGFFEETILPPKSQTLIGQLYPFNTTLS